MLVDPQPVYAKSSLTIDYCTRSLTWNVRTEVIPLPNVRHPKNDAEHTFCTCRKQQELKLYNSSFKKLLGTSASLLVTSASLLVTRSY